MNIIKEIETIKENKEIKDELNYLKNRLGKLESFLDNTLNYPVPSKRKSKLIKNGNFGKFAEK